jgi:hypothetical protein
MKCYRKVFDECYSPTADTVDLMDAYVTHALGMYFFADGCLDGAKKLCLQTRPLITDQKVKSELEETRKNYSHWASTIADIRNKIVAHADPKEGGHEWTGTSTSGIISFQLYNIDNFSRLRKKIQVAPNVDFFKLEQYLKELFIIFEKAWLQN